VTRGPDGLVRITLKKPFSDGTVAVDLDPLSLLSRLAASVPAPRLHTVRYAGVLASASKLRPRLAPKPVVAPAKPTADVAESPLRGAYRPWAELLKRTFGFDVLTCPCCSGRMKLLALVVDTTTKLTWMRMPETSGVVWADAKALCAGLTIDGGGFRLPKKEELLALGENLPEGIDRRAFPTASSREKHLAATVYYWTATPHAVSENMAWAVRFGSMGAQSTVHARTARNSVRCVK